jgi:alpha-tubulin suppressor-like RCC1 family protein
VALVACAGASLMMVAVAEAAPVNTKAPTVSGTDKEGRTLTAKEGSWSGTVESFSYVWQRCAAEDACANIESAQHVLATGPEYTLVAEDVDTTLRVLVTAHSSSGNGEAFSAQTKEIAGIPPKKEELPVISGKAEDGQLLSVSNGTWTGTPAMKYSYLWESCEKKECKAATGPDTGSSYRIVPSQEEAKETLRAVVTDESRAGNASATSAATATVSAGPPLNVAPPVISGEAREGQELRASPGTWAGTPTITYSYRWLSCTSLQDCVAVGTGSTHVAGALEVGDTLEIEVTAKNAVEPVSVTVTGGPVLGNPPVNTKPPTISGEAREGQELKASGGAWTGTEPISDEYEWKSCNTKSECSEKAGATYLLTGPDVGNKLEVVVTARNSVGSASATSAATGTVVGSPPLNTKLPAISGEAREGQTLTASLGTWTGTGPITYEYEWKSCNTKSECNEKAGATYLLNGSDVGNKLELLVTAKNSVGSASATSAAVGPVVGNPPVNTKRPAISGEAREGQTLTASAGTWTGTEPISDEYEWKSCNAKSECKEASGERYLLTGADVGNELEVVVTAKNSVGSASKSSAATAPVVGNPPHNTEAPKVEGVAREAKTLTASPGSWSGTGPFAYEYQWERCSALGEGCLPIPGATAQTYALGAADVGSTLLVKVTAKGAVPPSASATSLPTAVVMGRPANTELPKIEGLAQEGHSLTATIGEWTEEPTDYAYQWLSCNGEGACREASGSSYLLTQADVGDTLTVTVTATNAVGSSSATSTATARVQPTFGTAAVAWGKNGPDEQLGAGYLDPYELRPVSVLGLSEIAAVVAAGDDSYALLGNGTVKSWGSNVKGQLGDDSPHEPTGAPVSVLEEREGHDLTGVTAIAASYGSDTHAMALVNDREHEGEVATWGASEYGERGNGESGYYNEGKGEHAKDPRDMAVMVPDLKHVVAIAAGGNDDFALQAEGATTTLWAWGEDLHGRLGLGDEQQQAQETAELETEDATVGCLGEGGKKPIPCRTTPRPVDLDLPSGVEVTAISAGKHAAYAVLSNGRVLTWGENGFGELGNDSTTEGQVPGYVCAPDTTEKSCQEEGRYLEGIRSVAGGYKFALALSDTGEVIGWGADGTGQLGAKSTEECGSGASDCQDVPRTVAEGELDDVTQISAGAGFSLALESNGEVYSFGDSERGQLGEPEQSDAETCVSKTPCSRKPVLIAGLTDVGGISAGGAEYGEAHSLAFLRTGSGPAPLLSVTPEKAALKLTWRFTAFEDKIRWRPAAATTPEGEKAEEELKEIKEELQPKLEELNEATQEAEEDTKIAEKDNEKAEIKEQHAETITGTGAGAVKMKERLEKEASILRAAAATDEKDAAAAREAAKALEPEVHELQGKLKGIKQIVHKSEGKWSNALTRTGKEAKCSEENQCELLIHEYFSQKELGPEPYAIEVNPNAYKEEPEEEEGSRKIIGTPLP